MALALVIVIPVLPTGVVPALLARLSGRAAPTPMPAPIPLPAPVNVPNAPGSVLLDYRNVEESFGGLEALRGVTLSVHQGEILASA